MKNIHSVNTDNENHRDEDVQLLEKLPYMQLLVKRIEDIDNVISSGVQDGAVVQADTLLYNLPIEWVDEIKNGINAEKKKHSSMCAKINAYSSLMTSSERKKHLWDANVQYSRCIMQLVIGLLNKKKILLLAKKNLSGKSFKIVADGDDDE